MPYNKDLDVPQLQKTSDGNCTFTHCHAVSFSFEFNRAIPTPQEAKECQEFYEGRRAIINRCMFFTQKVLADKNLTPLQRATLEMSVENDKALIIGLNNMRLPDGNPLLKAQPILDDEENKSAKACCVIC